MVGTHFDVGSGFDVSECPIKKDILAVLRVGDERGVSHALTSRPRIARLTRSAALSGA